MWAKNENYSFSGSWCIGSNSKFNSATPGVKHIGYMAKADGIKLVLTNVKAISKFSPPTNLLPQSVPTEFSS